MPGRAKAVAVMRTLQLGVSIGSSRGTFAGGMPANRRGCYASRQPSVNSCDVLRSRYSREAWPRSHRLFSAGYFRNVIVERTRVGLEKFVCKPPKNSDPELKRRADEAVRGDAVRIRVGSRNDATFVDASGSRCVHRIGSVEADDRAARFPQEPMRDLV